jgi:hypothetical protein
VPLVGEAVVDIGLDITIIMVGVLWLMPHVDICTGDE